MYLRFVDFIDLEQHPLMGFSVFIPLQHFSFN